jgi:hypothetical protein
MKVNSVMKSVFVGLSAALLSSCGGTNSDKSNGCCTTTKTYVKKYTNADFYTNGKFNEAVAFEAFKDLFAFYGEPFTPLMEKEMWVTDFGLGDFEHAGMGGIFWVNDSVHNYFAHEIYLLPLQMIPEHAHVPTTFPAKFESWMVRNGMCYNFSEVGDPTPNLPALPESQRESIISKNCTEQHVGEILHLKKSETFHFLLAGPEGAIVSEWASYHDGNGLRFSNPKAKM